MGRVSKESRPQLGCCGRENELLLRYHSEIVLNKAKQKFVHNLFKIRTLSFSFISKNPGTVFGAGVAFHHQSIHNSLFNWSKK